MGELGFILPRFNAINEALASVGGVALGTVYGFLSSSEHSSNYARGLITNTGIVCDNNKSSSNRVRPFARLDSIVFPEPEGDNLNARLQTKQDKVDNALTTESKEIVGAINEINSTVSGITGYLGLDGGAGTEAGIKEMIRECVREYLSILRRCGIRRDGG